MYYEVKTLFYRIIMLLCGVGWLAGCATPIAPSGGPPDRTGPQVVDTSPQNGTTNFSGDKVTFSFDSFIDRASFRQNVTIEPDLGILFDVSFGRKSASVNFENRLPDSTTVIVKLGTDVTDTNNNKMTSSFDLAISTGDVLDDGRVTAQIVNAETGERESGNRLFLYREPADLTSRANYMAESDTSGRAEFSYLSEGTYRVFWLNDVNRNRTWDRERESAQPFSVETFDLGRGETADLGTLFISAPDTVAPLIEGVGLLSERRLRLRLSEPVTWNDELAEITILDTLDNEYAKAYPLYTDEADETVVFAESEEPLDESQLLTISVQGITDKAGNSLKTAFSPFQGSSDPDTTELTTILHNAGSGLFPNEALKVTYSKFIDESSVVDSLLVLEGDEMRSDWENLTVTRNQLIISPREQWESGTRYQFRVWNPLTREREQIQPEIWQRNQLGGIEFIVENGDSALTNVLRLTDREESISTDTTFTDTLLVDNLPPLEYRAIIFQDRNGNGRWDPGSPDPYRQPEKYMIRRAIPVREGFTSEVGMSYPKPLEITITELEPVEPPDEQRE